MAQAAPNSPNLTERRSSFNRSLAEPRTLVNTGLTVLAVGLSVFAMFPLFSVLYMLLLKGAVSLKLSLFTELTPGAGMEGGGIGNAIVGTLVVVLVSTAIALPLGFMGAVYLAEYGGESKLATLLRQSAHRPALDFGGRVRVCARRRHHRLVQRVGWRRGDGRADGTHRDAD